MSDKILHITNGDSVTPLIQKSAILGEILPWRDVLHDGPIPDNLDLQDLSQIRATFIASRGWGRKDDISASFQKRDRRLANSHQDDCVVLWFEHDLYDQLQLLQLLDWFSKQTAKHHSLYLIQVDDYLGMMNPEQIASLWDCRQPITAEQLMLGNRAWKAFRAPTPEPWAALLSQDTTALPYLGKAMVRQLEEFPAPGDGLSRTERFILTNADRGIEKPGRLFHAYQESEERKFMGDSSFWIILNELTIGPSPALQKDDGTDFIFPEPYPQYPSAAFREQRLIMTETGKQLLTGEKDLIQIRPLDRWIGGTHLTNDCYWRWDQRKLSLACYVKQENTRGSPVGRD